MTNLIDEAEQVVTAAAAPWLLYLKIGAALLISALLVGAGWWLHGKFDGNAVAQAQAKVSAAQTQVAQCQGAHEKARADSAEDAITALNQATAAASAAMDNLSKQAAARGVALDQFITEVNHVPSTSICGASAPELAFRQRVQPGQSAPAAAP